MNLIEKAGAVERVLYELDEEIKKFQTWSTLGCKVGCGKCCTKADIEATPLEFLPLALSIWQEGKADAWLDSLHTQTDNKICLVLNPSQLGVGHCTDYMHRGLICRVFGFSARLNKYNRKEMLTCSVIKTEQEGGYQKTLIDINGEGQVPLAGDFYTKLNYIDPLMSNQFMSINKAILRALELVSQYFLYRNQEADNPLLLPEY
jgi:Fe-S-cluster containining protein